MINLYKVKLDNHTESDPGKFITGENMIDALIKAQKEYNKYETTVIGIWFIQNDV